ncbi:MAG: Uncharacterized protein XD91_1513 [Clostridiales bacterium 38_11]|nr:MAG: Uncharacterized protein XD91_1513 [Clostridiales bacterium 38_11]HBH13102.1 hypothetical protein [Clostridiales bacterium]
MYREKIKNLVLIILVSIAIYSSSFIWLDLSFDTKGFNPVESEIEEIFLWDKIKPSKVSVTDQYEYIIHDSDINESVWRAFRDIMFDMFRFAYSESDIQEASPDSRTLRIYFDTSMPSELLIESFEMSNNRFQNVVSRILWIGYGVDSSKIYVNDGIKTYRLEITTNQQKLTDIYENIMIFASNKYDTLFHYGPTASYIPISTNETALNPVFIKSEIDIEDTINIENIAKNYFKDSFDYVRTTIDSSRTINYIYRNEKVLRLYDEGLLEFYDSIESTKDDSSMYQSFLIALNFIDDFLGFPDNAYLSQVTTFIEDGKYGYRFLFNQSLLERPIVFSQVRDEKAIQIDVIGSKVVFYQRFIRVVDVMMETEMAEVKVLSPQDIIENNIDFITELYLENPKNQSLEFNEAKEKILNGIHEIYLAYFDPSRRPKDQLMRSVWVIKTTDRNYVFNAITGAIIEEQVVMQGVDNGLE